MQWRRGLGVGRGAFFFDIAKAGSNGHYGLTSMQERAEAAGGSFKVESQPGHGTLVEAVAPHA